MGLLVGSFLWTAHASAQGFGVPISDRVVRAEITLPDGTATTVEIREGALLTVKNREMGYMIGLSPAIDEVDGHVELLVVDIEEVGRESNIEFLNQVSLVPGVPETLSTFLGEFDLKVSEVFLGSFPRQPLADPRRLRPKDLQQRFGATSGGICCVSCGSWTICGSSVRLGCGSCDGGSLAA
jgi:hypothetical protein